MELKICDEFYYRINENDENIFIKFNTSKDVLKRNNDKIKFYQGEWVKIKVNDYKTHIVKPAETLEKVSLLYNIDKHKLTVDNNIKNEKLYIGQILKIYK